MGENSTCRFGCVLGFTRWAKRLPWRCRKMRLRFLTSRTLRRYSSSELVATENEKSRRSLPRRQRKTRRSRRRSNDRATLMTMIQLQRLYDAQPFRAFVMNLANGQSVTLPHREFFVSRPTGRTVMVFLPDGSQQIIDLLLVTDIIVRRPSGSNGQRQVNEGVV